MTDGGALFLCDYMRLLQDAALFQDLFPKTPFPNIGDMTQKELIELILRLHASLQRKMRNHELKTVGSLTRANLRNGRTVVVFEYFGEAHAPFASEAAAMAIRDRRSGHVQVVHQMAHQVDHQVDHQDDLQDIDPHPVYQLPNNYHDELEIVYVDF